MPERVTLQPCEYALSLVCAANGRWHMIRGEGDGDWRYKYEGDGKISITAYLDAAATREAPDA